MSELDLPATGPPPGPPPEPRRDEPRRDDDITFARMLARRSVWLRTPLDHDASSRLTAELLALDAESHRPIELIINSPGGPVETAMGVVDALDFVQAPITTLCIGQALGTAAAILACGTAGRRATPTARLSLRLGSLELAGSASELRGQAQHMLELRDRLAVRLAAATGHLPAVVVIDLDDGGFMTAEQAVGYGLIDEVADHR